MPEPTSAAKTTPNQPLARSIKIVLSVLVVVQLLAVVAEPFRFFTLSTRGTSPAADPVRQVLAPYVEFAYLNHGYFFFAPEPGPSHLIDCRFTTQDGDTAYLRFPDRRAQWPRLLYHRHFMLTENLHQLWIHPPHDELIAEDDPLLPEWQSERARFEAVRASMMRHLVHRYDAQTVEIDRVEHRLPSDDEVFVERIRLNDKRLYVTLPDAPLANTESRTSESPTSAAESAVAVPAGESLEDRKPQP